MQPTRDVDERVALSYRDDLTGLRKTALMAVERIGGNAFDGIRNKNENDRDPSIGFRVKNFLQGSNFADRPPKQVARQDPSEAAWD